MHDQDEPDQTAGEKDAVTLRSQDVGSNQTGQEMPLTSSGFGVGLGVVEPVLLVSASCHGP